MPVNTVAGRLMRLNKAIEVFFNLTKEFIFRIVSIVFDKQKSLLFGMLS